MKEENKYKNRAITTRDNREGCDEQVKIVRIFLKISNKDKIG